MRLKAAKKSNKVKAATTEEAPKETEPPSTTVAAKPSDEIVKLMDQLQFEGTKNISVKTPTPTLKPSKAKGVNNPGFYPSKPSKHVNQHVRTHHNISQPRKITHSKLGRA